jgi:cyclophilin family peptidyl-prolyl cis-trans isomerase
MRNTLFIMLAILGILTINVYGKENEIVKSNNKKEKKMNETVKVKMETTLGNIVIELYPDKAPISVENFLKYVDGGFYSGTIFHRVIKDFVIQGGGFTENMVQKPTRTPIKNESTNGLKNDRGTIAMARTMIIDSATSQFYINLKNNDFLNHRDNSPQGYGYAVFGKVIEGMDVVDKIGSVQTGVVNGMSDVPLKPVIIKNIQRLQ